VTEGARSKDGRSRGRKNCARGIVRLNELIVWYESTSFFSTSIFCNVIYSLSRVFRRVPYISLVVKGRESALRLSKLRNLRSYAFGFALLPKFLRTPPFSLSSSFSIYLDLSEPRQSNQLYNIHIQPQAILLRKVLAQPFISLPLSASLQHTRCP